MPAYGPAGTATLIAPGETQPLINAADATAGNVTTTNAIGLGPTAGFNPTLTLVNSTNQTATVAVAALDTASSAYQPLTNADGNNAITCPASKAITFTCAAPFLLCTFASAPTSGLLTICR